MNKFFVFDLGNVIVKPMNKKLLYEMLDCNVTYEQFLDFFENDISSINIHKGYITDEEYIKQVIDFTGTKKTIEEFKKIFNGPIRNGLYEDTINIIKKLKLQKQKVCILSNLRKIDFEWFCGKYDIKNFDNLFLSYEMHMLKPDAEIYKDMIIKLNTDANNIYFFDDNRKNIEVAKNLNINSYITTGDTIKDLFKKEIKI